MIESKIHFMNNKRREKKKTCNVLPVVLGSTNKKKYIVKCIMRFRIKKNVIR